MSKAKFPVLCPSFPGQRRDPTPPLAYGKTTMDPETRAFLEMHALTIFSEMSNAGFPFRTVLATIFLTGLKYAVELGKEQDDD